MVFVDTSFLLALVSPRDSLHSRAQAWAKAIREPLLITEYVLWEVVNSLSSPMDRAKAHAVVSQIDSVPDWEVISASRELFEAGMQLHRERSDKACPKSTWIGRNRQSCNARVFKNLPQNGDGRETRESRLPI